MKVFSPNTSGENLLKELEKLAQKPLKNLIENSPQMAQFIGLQKLAIMGQSELSVDRPVDRQRSESDRWGCGRPGPLEQRADSLPVDRPGRPGHFQRAELSGWSTGRSTGPLARYWRARCARRSTARSTDFRVRSTGRSTG